MALKKSPLRNNPGTKILVSLNFTMSMAYLFCGSYLLISPSAGKIVPAEYIHITATCLVVYGAFRMYRTFLQYSTSKKF